LPETVDSFGGFLRVAGMRVAESLD